MTEPSNPIVKPGVPSHPISNPDEPTNPIAKPVVPPRASSQPVPKAGKVYHNRIPNSTFIAKVFDEDKKVVVGMSETLQWRGDTLLVTDPNHIAQLDQVADTPGCPIYTTNPAVANVGQDEPFAEVKNRAAEVVESIAKSGHRA